MAEQAILQQPDTSCRFVVHHHRAGRWHFDFRLIHLSILRSWSLRKEPPTLVGQQRLAIEGENFPPEEIHAARFTEAAYGEGRVDTWDEGEVEWLESGARKLVVRLRGQKLKGVYELRRMRWYPGNRWLLKKSPA